MPSQDHTQENCDRPYKGSLKRVGRAHYRCPVCDRDVSLEVVLLSMTLMKEKR